MTIIGRQTLVRSQCLSQVREFIARLFRFLHLLIYTEEANFGSVSRGLDGELWTHQHACASTDTDSIPKGLQHQPLVALGLARLGFL